MSKNVDLDARQVPLESLRDPHLAASIRESSEAAAYRATVRGSREPLEVLHLPDADGGGLVLVARGGKVVRAAFRADLVPEGEYAPERRFGQALGEAVSKGAGALGLLEVEEPPVLSVELLAAVRELVLDAVRALPRPIVQVAAPVHVAAPVIFVQPAPVTVAPLPAPAPKTIEVTRGEGGKLTGTIRPA